MRHLRIGALALALFACDGEDPPTDAGVDAGVDAGTDAGPPVIVLPDERAPCRDRNPLRNPYFGDLHVHTSISFDANAYGTRTRPDDAYRFARGETIGLPPYDGSGRPTRTLEIDRPLDFAAVTDHAEFFAEVDICTDPSSPGYGSSTCTSYRDGDGHANDYGELTAVLVFPGQRPRVCLRDPALCADRLGSVWQEVQDAAEDHYDRSEECAFTTFVGYEWTGSAGGTNLHRNILFRNRSVQRVPVSYVDATTPEALWTRLESTCLETDTPCDLLSIPHNGNLGTGRMFVPLSEGVPYTREQSERRAALEPLIEIYQHKGASECVAGLDHPLASEDELCSFEQLHARLCTGRPDDPEDCVDACRGGGGAGFLGGCLGVEDLGRPILRTGLAEWARTGADPFRVGFIGSTDTHLSIAGGVEERSYRGHAAEAEDEPSELLRVATPLVRGRTASPGGLAVVWAEENSRDALFDAMRRRETYATSGPRIVVRFFAGWSFPADLCDRTNLVEVGYADGVPMGGVLAERPADAGAPRFLLSALRDALGAPLQRIQIVKGWLSAGETHERVYEVAGDPENGATVDEASCEPSGSGFDLLCDVWTDPDFDPAAPTFYYARVIENPTCRWSRYVCNEAGVDCASVDASHPLYACCDPRVPHTIQERAWTSPVWYLPAP